MFLPSSVIASRATTIAIRSGEERSDVDVQLQPVRTVEVSGTLMDGSGPVSHFGVHLMPAEAATVRRCWKSRRRPPTRAALSSFRSCRRARTRCSRSGPSGVRWRIVSTGGAANRLRGPRRVGESIGERRRCESLQHHPHIAPGHPGHRTSRVQWCERTARRRSPAGNCADHHDPLAAALPLEHRDRESFVSTDGFSTGARRPVGFSWDCKYGTRHRHGRSSR